jgi:hypothetical protein
MCACPLQRAPLELLYQPPVGVKKRKDGSFVSLPNLCCASHSGTKPPASSSLILEMRRASCSHGTCDGCTMPCRKMVCFANNKGNS